MANSFVYHPCPSRLVSRIHPFIFLETPYGFISLQNVCWIFSNLYILPCMGKIFKFISFAFLENTLAINLDIFIHTLFLTQNSSQNSQQKGLEKTMICSIKIHLENVKITWNFRLLIFCMVCNDFYSFVNNIYHIVCY